MLGQPRTFSYILWQSQVKQGEGSTMHQGPIMSLAGTTYETLFECQQYSNQQPSYRSAFLSPNSGIFVTQPDYKSHLAVRLRHTQL